MFIKEVNEWANKLFGFEKVMICVVFPDQVLPIEIPKP